MNRRRLVGIVALLAGTLGLIAYAQAHASDTSVLATHGWVAWVILSGQIAPVLPQLLIVVAYVSGFMLILGNLRRSSPRQWIVIFAVCIAAYSAYFMFLVAAGRPTYPAAWRLSDWEYLPWLMWSTLYVALLMLLMVIPERHADLYGLALGILGSSMVNLVDVWRGPFGQSSSLRHVFFALAMWPFSLLIVASLVSTLANLAINLRSELLRRPPVKRN